MSVGQRSVTILHNCEATFPFRFLPRFTLRNCPLGVVNWIHSVILILSLQQLTVINTKERHYILNAEKQTRGFCFHMQINTTIILLRNGIVYQSGQNCQSQRREKRQIDRSKMPPQSLVLAASPLVVTQPLHSRIAHTPTIPKKNKKFSKIFKRRR